MEGVLVVKVGGRALLSNMDALVRDLAAHSKRYRIIFVHGGGDLVSEYSRRLGIEPRIVLHPSGLRSRYTSLEELEVYVMVMAGKINKEIISRLYKRGVKAIGISGADGGVLKARRKERIIIVDERGRKRVVEGGYTGRVEHVNTHILSILLNITEVLVLSPIAISDKGELLNIDADQAAFKVAEAVKPEALLMLSDVPGVIIDDEIIQSIRADEVESIIDKIGVGMNRKIIAAADAVKSGVGRAIIASGLGEEPIARAMRGEGTIIYG